MCMYTEREFRKVWDAISAMQAQLTANAERDRHAWASAIQAVRHAHAEDRTELRGAIDQMRHAIDRIRQQMTQLDGSSARQALTSDSSSPPPVLRGFQVCGAVERALYTELMHIKVTTRCESKQLDWDVAQLKQAIEMIRNQMRVMTAPTVTTASQAPRRHFCLICHSPCDLICAVCRPHGPHAGGL